MKIGLSLWSEPEVFDVISRSCCRSDMLLGRRLSRALIQNVCSACAYVLKMPCRSIRTERFDIAMLFPLTDGWSRLITKRKLPGNGGDAFFFGFKGYHFLISSTASWMCSLLVSIRTAWTAESLSYPPTGDGIVPHEIPKNTSGKPALFAASSIASTSS